MMDQLEETTNQVRERENPEKPGAWFVFAYDHAAYPIGLFAKDDEVSALRLIALLGYGHVVFWPFGTQWDDIT